MLQNRIGAKKTVRFFFFRRSFSNRVRFAIANVFLSAFEVWEMKLRLGISGPNIST